VAWRVRLDLLDGGKDIMIGACLSERAQEVAQCEDPYHDMGFVGARTDSGFASKCGPRP